MIRESSDKTNLIVFKVPLSRVLTCRIEIGTCHMGNQKLAHSHTSLRVTVSHYDCSHPPLRSI